MDRPYESVAEIEWLVTRFLDCTLPCAEWTHRAHLTVGLWHARDVSAGRSAGANAREHSALQRDLPGSHHAHAGLSRDDHAVLHDRAGPSPGEITDLSDWTAVTNRAIELYGARELPFDYYTHDRLMSAEARAAWVAPDLRPLG